MATAINWKNKKGTEDEKCICGDWKRHWVKFSRQPWPAVCSVAGCNNIPELGAHIINDNIVGERIVPMCGSCNNSTVYFNLGVGIRIVNANKSNTCEKIGSNLEV